jgi:hypothetical protein
MIEIKIDLVNFSHIFYPPLKMLKFINFVLLRCIKLLEKIVVKIGSAKLFDKENLLIIKLKAIKLVII